MACQDTMAAGVEAGLEAKAGWEGMADSASKDNNAA